MTISTLGYRSKQYSESSEQGSMIKDKQHPFNTNIVVLSKHIFTWEFYSCLYLQICAGVRWIVYSFTNNSGSIEHNLGDHLGIAWHLFPTSSCFTESRIAISFLWAYISTLSLINKESRISKIIWIFLTHSWRKILKNTCELRGSVLKNSYFLESFDTPNAHEVTKRGTVVNI